MEALMIAFKNKIEKIINSQKEKILSNIVIAGQIPAPSGSETKRAEYAANKFNELGLLDIKIDEIGNCSAIMPGQNHNSVFVICSNMDTIFGESIDHNYTIIDNRISGPGIANNSLGFASVITIADILSELQLTLNCDIMFVMLSQTLETADNKGIKHFLNKIDIPIERFLFLESINLGRLSYFSTGMARFSVQCETPEGHSFINYGSLNAIDIITELAMELLKTPLTKRPRSTLNISKISGGTTYNAIATDASLNLEIRSESKSILEKMKEYVINTIEHIRFKYQTTLDYKMFFEINPLQLKYSDHYVKEILKIHKMMNILSNPGTSDSILAFPLERKIPSVAVAVAKGKRTTHIDGYIFIDSIFTGLIQLLLIIYKFNSNVP
jgi:tripeptide aminopeptidase